MRDAVIVAALRTPIGSFGGQFKDVSAVSLGSEVVKAIIKSVNLAPDQIDEVIIGNVISSGLGQNVARQVAIKAGIPIEVPSYTINKVCGSGLKAVSLAAQAIMVGESDVVIAGGTENMSQAPFLASTARFGSKLGNQTLVDSMLQDALLDAFSGEHMGVTAENVAKKYQITRLVQDQLAVASQERASKAIEAGRFDTEICPIKVSNRKGDTQLVNKDEYPRPQTTLEKLSQLRPVFQKDGTVTAGNASGINDGAAAVIVMSRDKAAELGLKPLVVIKGSASAGVAPDFMGCGPIASTKKLLERLNMTIDGIDLIESNEAFAALSVCVNEALGFDPTKVNVNGGAIALGHPVGASGTRILVTLIHELLKQEEHHTGLATLCIGGGQGMSMVVEKVE
ncbi:MAG: acetyl-CoA C-acetyltransferase [Bavariicoccus seileri]|uniref:acetyl-CoA C-acetyltransferase n=1 Tax=Bavariicoccus seileri TaxID=549685 RepID=A0A3D4S3S5_9ENTE|nr:acetyl-CoA C-acetyltransferase [Bavariicoccus seileri]HCS93286.1 acetyl-CoA C-acetyltransferase [Bavariicoccus seileri]